MVYFSLVIFTLYFELVPCIPFLLAPMLSSSVPIVSKDIECLFGAMDDLVVFAAANGERDWDDAGGAVSVAFASYRGTNAPPFVVSAA